jgi:hypothetical protein
MRRNWAAGHWPDNWANTIPLIPIHFYSFDSAVAAASENYAWRLGACVINWLATRMRKSTPLKDFDSSDLRLKSPS